MKPTLRAPQRTLRQIADHLGGELSGDGSIAIGLPCHPRDATAASDLILLLEPAAIELLAASPARAALVARKAARKAPLPEGRLDGAIWVDDPRFALAALLDLYAPRPTLAPGIHPSAVVDPSVELGEGVAIGPFVAIGPGCRIGAHTSISAHVTIGAEVKIGRDGIIHPGARIGDRVRIGDGVILHHNASIGADGFSFATNALERAATGAAFRLQRIASLGSVEIGDDVEIGANSAIDRGNVGDTAIGRGTKIDDLVLIGHNAVIGEDCLIAGQVGVAGSCVIGNRVILGGKVGVADHVRIGDDAMSIASASIAHDVKPGVIVGGQPAIPIERFREQLLYIGRLRRMAESLRALKARLDPPGPDGGSES